VSHQREHMAREQRPQKQTRERERQKGNRGRRCGGRSRRRGARSRRNESEAGKAGAEGAPLEPQAGKEERRLQKEERKRRNWESKARSEERNREGNEDRGRCLRSGNRCLGRWRGCSIGWIECGASMAVSLAVRGNRGGARGVTCEVGHHGRVGDDIGTAWWPAPSSSGSASIAAVWKLDLWATALSSCRIGASTTEPLAAGQIPRSLRRVTGVRGGEEAQGTRVCAPPLFEACEGQLELSSPSRPVDGWRRPQRVNPALECLRWGACSTPRCCSGLARSFSPSLMNLRRRFGRRLLVKAIPVEAFWVAAVDHPIVAAGRNRSIFCASTRGHRGCFSILGASRNSRRVQPPPRASSRPARVLPGLWAEKRRANPGGSTGERVAMKVHDPASSVTAGDGIARTRWVTSTRGFWRLLDNSKPQVRRRRRPRRATTPGRSPVSVVGRIDGEDAAPFADSPHFHAATSRSAGGCVGARRRRGGQLEGPVRGGRSSSL
jgi:hypothetical protein